MNLLEALEILRQTDSKNENLLKVFLACSFTPLHLQTFLAAHLRQRSSKQRVEVRTGVFGDLAGNIERLPEAGFNVLAVVIEWQDLDSRLGIRNLGGWRITDLPDIVRSAELALTRLEKAMRRASLSIPTYVCMPSLPFPPFSQLRLSRRVLANFDCDSWLLHLQYQSPTNPPCVCSVSNIWMNPLQRNRALTFNLS